MSKLPLSVCMIVKNEAQFLSSSLESVIPWCQEVIVADTGSEDESSQIASALGARVISLEWPDSFSVARNMTLNYATHNWILVLDGDEILDQPSAQALSQLIAEPLPVAYYVYRRHYTTSDTQAVLRPVLDPLPLQGLSAVGYQLTEDVRLFRRGLFRYSGRVHELIEGSIWDKGHEIGKSSLILHHLAAFKFSGKEQKHALYLSLARQQYDESPTDWKAITQLATELEQNQLRDEAYVLLAKHVVELPDNPHILKAYGLSCVQQGIYTDAITALGKTVEIESNNFEAWSGLGLALLRLGHFDGAVECYNFCVTLLPHDLNALINLGITLLHLERDEEASQYFQKAYDLYSASEPARIGMLVSKCLQGRAQLPAELNEKVRALFGDKILLRLST
jgi:Flp pilus assembly protein TadD